MTQGSLVRSISYTADGNTLTDNLGIGAVFTYGYNNDNRMVQASLGGATQASYTLNYLGQRVIKSAVTSGTTDFHYDRAGHLIAESDGAGNVLREYVFLDNTPVAFVTPAGGIDIIHTDHLGTPQKMTDATQAVVWDGGSSDPFMMSALPLTPAMNQRFPGQYYDGETGLHQNGFRDYDPSLGRYVESDPIGLGGGINTYAYVGGNPLNYTDPSGRMVPSLAGIGALGGEAGLGGRLAASILGANPEFALPVLAGAGLLYWALEHYFPVPCDTPPYYSSSGDGGSSSANNNNSSGNNGNSGNQSSQQQGKGAESPPDLTDAKGANHILNGDDTGGGHRAGTGNSGKSEFPADWSDDKIKGEISDVATAPSSTRRMRGGRTVSEGTREGIDIRTIDDGLRIITGYPTNTPRNP